MTELQTLLIQAQAWHDQDPDPATRAELAELIQTKDEPALIFADFLIWRESELSFQEK